MAMEMREHSLCTDNRDTALCSSLLRRARAGYAAAARIIPENSAANAEVPDLLRHRANGRAAAARAIPESFAVSAGTPGRTEADKRNRKRTGGEAG